MEYLVYGLAEDETRDYMESLLFTNLKRNQVEKALELAHANGYHNLRVATYNGEAPNFIKVVN